MIALVLGTNIYFVVCVVNCVALCEYHCEMNNKNVIQRLGFFITNPYIYVGQKKAVDDIFVCDTSVSLNIR